MASTGIATTTAEGDFMSHYHHNNGSSISSRGALSLAQVQAQSLGSMASIDSGSSASFHKHRKRSESTGGFKSTAGNISRIVRKGSSNFLKKFVKNFDDKDAPPIPTPNNYFEISATSPSGTTTTTPQLTSPDPSMVRSLSSQSGRKVRPLDTPPPLSPLLGQELSSRFTFGGKPEQHTNDLTAVDTIVTGDPQFMSTAFTPKEVADSLALLVEEAVLIPEDYDETRERNPDEEEDEEDEEDEEYEDGDEDEDEDEDVPAAITNRLSRLYDTGSIHLNQSQTSLYYSVKSTLSDEDAAERRESMDSSETSNPINIKASDRNSRRASYVQDALGYSLGLSRGNSIRFSQYSLGSLHGFSGAPVQPLTSSTSTPSSPGTVRGMSSPSAHNEFGEARRSIARRPMTMFIPLSSGNDDHPEADSIVGTDSTSRETPTTPSVQESETERFVAPPEPISPVSESATKPLTIETSSLPPSDGPDSSPILPSSFGRILVQPPVPKRPLTVCVDTDNVLKPQHPLATPTLVTPNISTTEDQLESSELLAKRTARRCFDEDKSFLRREEISEYLGTPKPFHQQVVTAYMNHFDFRGKRIDFAFRLLCQKLILKGETQEVDRILEAFAQRYVDCNDTRSSGSSAGGRSRPMLLAVADNAKDVVHAVSYSILLLNTDLHVVQQSTKMSRSAFVKNTLEVVQAQKSSSGLGSAANMSLVVDPAGLGMPRSLTSDSIPETGLAPSTSASSFPSMGKRRTPSVKSWKSGHSQQSGGYDPGNNINTNLNSNNSKMGTDPSANGGYGNGKAWTQELENLFKEIYTSVKQSQIRLPSSAVSTTATTPVTGPLGSRSGSRSNSTFSAVSSPPTSPSLVPTSGGFGSSLFSSNRMSRLIQPNSLFASNQQSQQPQGLYPGGPDQLTDSGVGLFGGAGANLSRKRSISARTSQLRNEAIQRLNAQAQAQAETRAQSRATALAVAQAQAEAEAETKTRSSNRPVSTLITSTLSIVPPTSRSRHSVFGNFETNFGGSSGSSFVNRGPVSSQDIVYPQHMPHSNPAMLDSTGTIASTGPSSVHTTTSSDTTTPSASQNSLASLQSSTLSLSVGGPHDEQRRNRVDGEDVLLETARPEEPHPLANFMDEFTKEQKEQRHHLHLQSRYRIEGILWRKHLLERSDKKAQHRAWRQLLVVLDMEQGSLTMFRSDGTLPSLPKASWTSPTSKPLSSSASSTPSSAQQGSDLSSAPATSVMINMPLFDEIPLQHTITNILPPPGYSSTRQHVFAVQLFTGAVYLFQTSSPQECEIWARSCNYWAARTSKEPLIGGVINMDYGWGRALEVYMSRPTPSSPSSSLYPQLTSVQQELGLSPVSQTAVGSPFVQSPVALASPSPPALSSSSHNLNQPADANGYFGATSSTSGSPLQSRSTGRSTSMKSSSSRRGSISLSSFSAITGSGSVASNSLSPGSASIPLGDQITIFEWTAPQPAMALSPHAEETDQLRALKKYVRGLESEMELHQEHRGPMLKLFPPKSTNHMKAFNNWERRSRHLLKEMVKYQIYVECLEMSISFQSEHDLLELKAWQTLLDGQEQQARQPPHQLRKVSATVTSTDLEADLEALVVHEEPDL
ncbi:hypothetical protein BGZ83_001545 [Gryganskiella cystojenkinii]|nr:hypothetical protein BGZ83_001545 [Gryganskiella cystojenkinii]